MNLTGKRFGRLKAIKKVENKKTGTYWLCKCNCGNEKEVFIGHLRSGKIRSCGCLQKEKTRKHGLSKTPEYISWCAMRNRCLSSKTNGYDNYGGKGVTICDRWSDFNKFLQDMGPRPSSKHSLERINANGDYTPENCKWETTYNQNRNKTNSKRYIIDGNEYKTAKEAGEAYGVTGTTIRRWCEEGLSPKLNINCKMYSIYA